MKRILDCRASDFRTMDKAQLLAAIAGAEGRTLACETIGSLMPMLGDVTNAEFAAAMADPEPPFPIAKEVIEGYFDPSGVPAYKRMCDLLEQVHREPPRDAPMGEGFTPHFNWLKFFALWGVHILHFFRLEPKKVFFFHKGLADFAQRIYGYVDKAYVAPAAVKAMEARIRPYVK